MSIKLGKAANYNTKGTIWRPEVKTSSGGKEFIKASISTGKKVGNEYRNSNWFCTFVGDAAKKFKELGIVERDIIEITNGEMENIYVKEKEQSYLSLVIYDFEKSNSTGGGTTTTPNNASGGFMNIPDGIDEELPFN